MANITDYLNNIYNSKKAIKQSLIDMRVDDPTDNFSVYPDKMSLINTMPRIDINTDGDVVIKDKLIIEENDGNEWLECELPTSADWRSITYGNGMFVAIANGPNISAYSTDGINWIQTNLPITKGWRSVTYGNGKFVAVAVASNISVYSTDGINWTQTTLPTSANWYSVTYGNGKFVAVADNSNISAYSTDGINWTQTTLPTSAYWFSVTYGNGKFVAVSLSSNISAYSTDGINWIQSTIPASAKWMSITYGNGMFVAIANGSNISAYSTDGINWIQTNLPITKGWRSVTYGNGKFVAIAYSSNISAYSTDGINWIQTTLPASANWQSVTYGNGKFVAVVRNSNVSACIDSNFNQTIHNEEVLSLKEDYKVKGYIKPLVNSFTVDGTYGTSSYIKIDDCTAITGNDNTIYIIMGGGISTSYESIDFAIESLPSGVTLNTQTKNDGTSASKLFIAKILGVTAPVNITVGVDGRSSSSDYYTCNITIAYV